MSETPSNAPVEVDRGARGLADLAYIETPGPTAQRVSAAISAYLWACREAKPWEHNPEMMVYPSLNDLRAFLAANLARTNNSAEVES